ncbi:MAG: (2Fe-2S)-binding protein [Clostridiales bacterium]|nr:(2Fe-2S)-binding protein [Clostridiales bacterium]
MKISFTLNGKAVTAEVHPGENLLAVLRRLGIMSIKCACDSANCGCCTVWVNGHPALSCAYPAPRADGQEITTLEALSAEAEAFAAYMADEGADQCGFCNPGFVMNVLAMKRELTEFTDENVKTYLAGNLCRCTGFASQHRAIAKWLAGEGKEAGKE